MPTATAPESVKYRRRWWTLAVLSMSLVIIGLDNTVLNVALPTIQTDLSASASALQWMVDAYVLVFAGLLLTMGALGDRYGRKRMLQAGLLLFGASSIYAAYSGSTSHLIFARGLMGAGGALIMPSTLSIVIDVFPLQERGKAIGIWAGIAAAGVGLGPAVGGWLLENFWWGSVFLVNVPVVAVALVLGGWLVPESRDPSQRQLDMPGAALSIAGLLALVYAIIEAPDRGWLDPVVLAGFGLALLLGAGFALRELRGAHPMLELSLFRNPRFLWGATAITMAFFALFGGIFILTQYLQFVLGYSPLRAGLGMMPIAVGMMAGATQSDRLVRRFGSNRVVAFGLLVVAGTLASVSFWSVSTPYWIVGLSIAVLSFGMGMTTAPATDAVMGAVPLAKAGVGSAMNDTTRQLGGALGVAVIGSVLNTLYASRVAVPPGLPAAASEAARNSVGAAVHVGNLMGGPAGQALAEGARQAFVDGMTDALLVAAGVAFVGALLVLRFLPGRHLTEEQPGQAEGTRRQGAMVGARPLRFEVRNDD